MGAAGRSAACGRRLNIRIYPHCEVERIDSQARQLHTGFGVMDYGQLVLACGAGPLRPPVEGGSDALLSVNNLEDYRQFREQLAGKRRVAILGDGLIGCEFANDLAASGFAVSVGGPVVGWYPLAP